MRGIVVTCPCGVVYELRSEYAGRLLECPSCQRHLRAGARSGVAASSAGAVPGGAFDHDVFLFRQRALSIPARYEVLDQHGQPLFFVERPTYPVRTALAYLGAAVGTAVVLITLLPVSIFLAPVVFVILAMSLRPRRHVTFYRDETRTERILEIVQDQRVALLERTYTVRLPDATPLARLSKLYLHDLLRKQWLIKAPSGELLARAVEDSVILSLLRRSLGSFFGLLRTNFLILRGGGDDVIGEFNRRLTVRDRYVLDLGADGRRELDRRIAVALGVMLDTGERR